MPEPRAPGASFWRAAVTNLNPTAALFAAKHRCRNGVRCLRFKMKEMPLLDYWRVMNRDVLLDELRRVEREVVEGERKLAEHETALVALTKQNQDTSKAQTALNLMREEQRHLDQDRQRLLSLLQR